MNILASIVVAPNESPKVGGSGATFAELGLSSCFCLPFSFFAILVWGEQAHETERRQTETRSTRTDKIGLDSGIRGLGESLPAAMARGFL